MYTIYTDKSENFKCKIGVEGTKLDQTKARLVVEVDGFDILFEGKIDSEGNCTVPIKKMKNILYEGDKGNMKLEVIADDTYFTPWSDEYTVEANKKVTVEVVDQEETIKENKITVHVEPQNKKSKKIIGEVNHGKEISKILIKNGITLSNIGENKTRLKKIIKEYSSNFKNGIDTENLLDDIVNNLRF